MYFTWQAWYCIGLRPPAAALCCRGLSCSLGVLIRRDSFFLNASLVSFVIIVAHDVFHGSKIDLEVFQTFVQKLYRHLSKLYTPYGVETYAKFHSDRLWRVGFAESDFSRQCAFDGCTQALDDLVACRVADWPTG